MCARLAVPRKISSLALFLFPARPEPEELGRVNDCLFRPVAYRELQDAGCPAHDPMFGVT
jgi:hypothetical protein